jgi:hypothetical protein
MKHPEPHPLARKTVRLKLDVKHPQVPGFGGAEFRIEDWWDRVAGKSWMFCDGNPACLVYAMRTGFAETPIPTDDEVVYGQNRPIWAPCPRQRDRQPDGRAGRGDVKYTPAKSLRGKAVYMDQDGAAWPYKFVRWVKTKLHTGGEDTDKIGVGALVYVPWRCGPPFNRKPPRGFTKGHFVLRAYWPLYRSPYHFRHRKELQRPPAGRVRMFRDSG